MILSKAHYHLAANLGLPLWFERRSLLSIKSTQVFATLGIVLSQTLITEEEHKVFNGMLRVFSIQKSSQWIGWFQKPIQTDLTPQCLVNELQRWYPQIVLGMGQPLRETMETIHLLESAPLFQVKWTYHPKELIENPNLKKEAYQELLDLKEILRQINQE